MDMFRAMPVLQVGDVLASESFYKRLGFQSHGAWTHAGVAQFCIVERGQVTLALQRTEDTPPINSHWAAYLYVADVTTLHAEYAALNLPELTEIRRGNPYGCDDFDVVDLDGHRIAFGQDVAPTNGPGLAGTKEL